MELPSEVNSKPGVCGKLKFWPYGFRKAASAWEKHYAGMLESASFVRGEACEVVFYHSKRDISLVVHGDDFTFCGIDEDSDRVSERMKAWFDVKIRGRRGPSKSDVKEIVILGRIVRWTKEDLEWEADPKHLEILMAGLGFKADSKPLGQPAAKMEKCADTTPLKDEQVKQYRSRAMRLSSVAQDRPDLQYASKELARAMQSPTAWDAAQLKRAVTYFKGADRMVQRFH